MLRRHYTYVMKMAWRRRRRQGRRGRFPKPVAIPSPTQVNKLVPTPLRNAESIFIEPAEVEVLRLVDLEELSQEETGQKMGISRGTVWRLSQSARKKVAQALTEGRPLIVTRQGRAPNENNP
jgi:predicted DNA-binding protein (UPF0251 family)